MSLQEILIPNIKKAVFELYDISIDKIEFQATRKEFEGDITIVIFPFLKQIKGNPSEIGAKIGNYLAANISEVEKFNVVAGFLNIVISDNYFIRFFNQIYPNKAFAWFQAFSKFLAFMYSQILA